MEHALCEYIFISDLSWAAVPDIPTSSQDVAKSEQSLYFDF